jgi:hypothetical protein
MQQVLQKRAAQLIKIILLGYLFLLGKEKRIARDIIKPTRIKESFTILDTTSLICNFGLAIWINWAVFPKNVLGPVEITTPVASPFLTIDPE